MSSLTNVHCVNSSYYELVDVDGWLEEFVPLEVEESDALLAEVAWMVSVEECSVVGEATCVTSTTGMLSVSSDTTVAAADTTSHLPDLSESGSHRFMVNYIILI